MHKSIICKREAQRLWYKI